MAKTVVAHAVPSFSYMGLTNNGSAAASTDHMYIRAAIALAACLRYTSIKYAVEERMFKRMPLSMMRPARTCAAHGSVGCDVQVTQRSPMGNRKPDMTIGTRCHLGEASCLAPRTCGATRCGLQWHRRYVPRVTRLAYPGKTGLRGPLASVCRLGKSTERRRR